MDHLVKVRVPALVVKQIKGLFLKVRKLEKHNCLTPDIGSVSEIHFVSHLKIGNSINIDIVFVFKVFIKICSY